LAASGRGWTGAAKVRIRLTSGQETPSIKGRLRYGFRNPPRPPFRSLPGHRRHLHGWRHDDLLRSSQRHDRARRLVGLHLHRLSLRGGHTGLLRGLQDFRHQTRPGARRGQHHGQGRRDQPPRGTAGPGERADREHGAQEVLPAHRGQRRPRPHPHHSGHRDRLHETPPQGGPGRVHPPGGLARPSA
jgi:hypothetical protein